MIRPAKSSRDADHDETRITHYGTRITRIILTDPADRRIAAAVGPASVLSVYSAANQSVEGEPMKLAVFALALSTILAQGTAPAAGVHVWKSSDIAAKGKALGQKLDAQKVASETIATEGNRTFMVAHREGSGVAEWHEKQADILMISSGEVTMIYGGSMVAAKTTQPGEMRGPSIMGGTEVRLAAGDVLHIPAKVPHQMILAPGAQVTYFVTKVVE
jgi:mannose-6-phosphate isomerase-like protein (cupin superfamily)